jgi:hypothetical protein
MLADHLSPEFVVQNVNSLSNSTVVSYVALLLRLQEFDAAVSIFSKIEHRLSDDDDFANMLRFEIALATTDDLKVIRQAYRKFEKGVFFIPVVKVQ